ncbi:MAG: GAF domain-containing protein [Anaerolineales bacterium]|nr:GAF domain-containing protein [Anaerolineales bacterium]
MKILYIEDNSAHVELTLRSLDVHGAEFDLQTAKNLQEAFSLLKTTEYDVILCDHSLPDGSGLDVIQFVRERGITTAIVLITNQDDIKIAVAALKAGASDYVVKQSDYLHRLPIILQNAHSQTQIERQKLALRESENRYRNIFENAAEGLFQSTPDGKFLSVNPAMAEIFGYDSPEAMLNSVTNISGQIHVNAESREKFIEELMAKGSVVKFETQNLRKDGSIIWTSTNARVVKNENGDILYFEGFLTDISERKQAELAIEASESKYKTLVERFPGVVFLDDFYNDTVSRYMSPRLKDVLGYTPEEWGAGDNLWDNSLHPEDRDKILAEDKRTNETGDPFQVEYRIKKKDGCYVWIREDTHLIRDQAGNPNYWLGIMLDITAQKEAQEAAKANEGSYRGLFNTVDQAIYIQDKNGRFLDVNDGAVKMYGFPREYFIGKTPLDLSAPGKNDIKNLIKMMERAFTGKAQEFEFWGKRSDGQVFPKIVNLSRGTYFGQDVIIAVSQDITERKQAEETLERQLLELTILHATSMAGTHSNTEDEIIEQTIRIIASIFTEVCGVLLLNDKGDQLIPHPSCIGPNVENWENSHPITMGITGRAVITGRAIRVDNVTNDPEYMEITSGIKSELCVPFWVQSHIIGVLDVESKRENAFDEKDERLLNTIAAGLGTAIEKLRLYKAEQAQSQREAAILDLLRTAASSLDLDQVLHSILGQIIKVIPSDSGTIQLLDGDQLNILAATGREATVFAQQGSIKLSRFPLNEYVIKEKKTIRVDDAHQDTRYQGSVENENLRSFLGIPLIAKENAIGIITLDSYQTARFTEEDAELGLAIASHASIAIENARLFDAEQRRRKQAESLRIATEALTTSVEMDKVFEIIFDSLAELVPYDSASIETVRGGDFKIIAGRGIAEELLGKKYSTQPEKWGNSESIRQPIIIPDVQTDSRFEKLKGSEYIRCWMGIPLFSQGKLTGYLNLDSRTAGFFNLEHAAIAQTFANQAAIAMENARLFQEENRRTRIIEAMANIANEIATTKEVISALDKIAERAISLLNASTIAVYLLQEDNKTIKIVTAQGAYQKEMMMHTINVGDGITGNVIASGKAEIINDIAKDPRKITVPGTPEDDARLDTMMSAPLILHGKSIGAINAWRLKSNGLFDMPELNFLVSIAQQASISIESVRLFEETMRRAQEAAAIAEVGRDISATPQLNIVLERIALYARDLLKAQTSAVYLAEPNQPLLRAISAIGAEAEEIKNDPIQTGVGILGNIALQKFGEIVNDTMGDPRSVTIKGTQDDPYEHIMGVPVLSKGQLTGLVVVWRSGSNNEFRTTDLEFLSSLAQQAAVAIENARLFELEQRRRKEAETVMHATMALANLLDLPGLFNAILEWLYKITPYDSASIMEIEEDHLRVTAARGLLAPEKVLGQVFSLDNILCNTINETGKALIIDDCLIDDRFEKWGDTDHVRGWMGVPLISRGRVIGYITMDSYNPNAFTENNAIVTQTFSQQAATAIENVRLFEAERKRRFEADNLRLAATAITSSLDPQEVLETILTALKQVVPFDLGSMMLLEDENVRIVAAQGFSNNKTIVNQTFPSQNELLLIIKQTQRPLILENALADTRYERWAGADFIRGWLGIPLAVHGNIIGYITLGSFKFAAFDQNAADLAQTFALHAAAAIDNTQLFKDLQKSNQELIQAYDTTLAGWGKALELRDKETHGHTQRVTNLTLDLARQIGLSKAELTQLQRGVMLHDIGKMGVPDEILHKTGPLTEEEFVEMRKHTQYAFDLLYPITFLRSSLDIPYSHHEWWNGSGYPQGLKGEEIPLHARIFAIVDVWDALLSNRPYRQAWEKEKVIQYIRDQAGSHFDPNIVEVFLKMMRFKDIQEKEKTQPIKKVD